MEVTNQEIIYVIAVLAKKFEEKYDRDAVNYFLTKHCYVFALILKKIFPEGEIMHNEGHVVFQLNDSLYDIRRKLSLFHLINFGGTELYSAETEEGRFACEMQFWPDDSDEAKEVMTYLQLIGLEAKSLYEETHFHKAKKI